MATIQVREKKDGTKTYRAIVRMKGIPTQSATFRTRTHAKTWVKTTEAAILEGRHLVKSEAKRHSVADMIDRYLESVAPQKKSVVKTIQQLGWWRDQIGRYLLSDVTASLLAEHRDKLASEPLAHPRQGRIHRTPATVNRYLEHMSHCLTIAVKEWGWLETNPMQNVSKLREPRGRVRFLSDDERERLLKACKKSSNKDLYTVVVLALSTGARRMEIWALKWDEVDFARKTIILHKTKNDERLSLIHI